MKWEQKNHNSKCIGLKSHEECGKAIPQPFGFAFKSLVLLIFTPGVYSMKSWQHR